MDHKYSTLESFSRDTLQCLDPCTLPAKIPSCFLHQTLKMDLARSAKRRKLDTPQYNAPTNSSTSRGKATPITYSKKHTALNNGTRVTPTAHENWLEAKAKSQDLRGKRPRGTPVKERCTDVYDDVEGAFTHRSPLKKTTPTTSTPAKKQLDPLRNQKSASAASSSPSKSLHFFKQFHSPKPVVANAALGVEATAQKRVNGTGSHGSRHAEQDALAGARERSDDVGEEEQDREQHTPVKAAVRGSWKGWARAEKPVKTFEDEIREVEAAARGEAENEDNGAVSSSAQKRSSRKAPLATNECPGEAKDRKSPERRSTPNQPKSVDKRKNNRADHTDTAVASRDEQEDGLDFEHSGPQHLPAVYGDREISKAHKTMTSTKIRPQHSTKDSDASKETSLSPEHLSLVQKSILEKLTGKRPIRLTNLDDEYTKVSSLITQTITAGESNSMLLIGTRGSGKTALVNQILREQRVKHLDDFHIVRLNGFIHTDDKIALREIWRQLGREMNLEQDDSTSKNYADTLTTLLALLSHPAEQDRDQPDHVAKSVIFILDEFELFASHPRQTLLYNLFDIAQSRKAPIAVLGLTTRIDVAENLEKRVKSRFSHRYVHLSLAKSFVDFQEACKAAITIHPSELTSEERRQHGGSNDVITKADKLLKKHHFEPTEVWNAFVGRLLEQEMFTNRLRRLYYTTKSVSEFHTSMLILISTIPTTSEETTTDLLKHFTTAFPSSSVFPLDSKLTLLPTLSTLQLALLICAARLTAIHNADTVPFVQAYEEYKVLASKAKLQASASGALAQGAGSRISGKAVARGAWEGLVRCGLLVEDGGSGERVDVGLEEIGMCGGGLDLGSWGRWCREI